MSISNRSNPVADTQGEKTNDQNLNRVLCNRVTELRKSHKFTLDQLATLSGVSRSMLSQIERGQANPTLAITFRIANAFGLSIGELVESTASNPNIEVVHGSDPNNIFRADDECRIRTLSPLHMEKNVEFYELCIEPKASLTSTAHFEGTQELLTVTSGTAEIVSGETVCKLSAGDSANYRADLRHSVRNCGQGKLSCYLVVTYL